MCSFYFLLAMQLYSSVCMRENYKQGLPMKKIFILFTLLAALTDLRADTTSGSSQLISLGAEKPKVRLQLEINPAEIEPLGLKIQNLQTDLMTKLIQSNVLVQDEPKNPLLLLRLKTIDANGTWATFIQLAFFENAELTRNKSSVLAMTWSQASLLSTSKEDFQQEVTKTVLAMGDAFVKDYIKAYTPAQ